MLNSSFEMPSIEIKAVRSRNKPKQKKENSLPPIPSRFPLEFKMDPHNILVHDASIIENFNNTLDSITDVKNEKNSGFYVEKKDIKSLK
jgi:hypothetical protein